MKLRNCERGEAAALLPVDNLVAKGAERSTSQDLARAGGQPRVVSSSRGLRSDVERRQLTAMKTLRALSDRNYFIMRSSSPDYVREAVTAYGDVEDIAPRFQRSPADISNCLVALGCGILKGDLASDLVAVV